MKKQSLFILLLCMDALCHAAIVPRVDRRVEIMSIVARLAGYDEYNDNMARDYVEQIHTHFDPYANDSLIHFAKEIRERSGVSYDAVMTMAVNLEHKGQTFFLQANWEKDIDKRWTKETAERFIQLLNRFYRKSDAEKFFSDQSGYYDRIVRAFQQVLNGFDQSWYFSYYGTQPKDEFTVVIGCANGGSNYGPAITRNNGTKIIYAIMGSWSFDQQRAPVFPQNNYLPTLIHEFNHSFINPSVEHFDGNPMLQSSMQTLLDTMNVEMQSQAYDKWQTVLAESLVRASVIRYLMKTHKNDTAIVENEMMEQLNRGFIWMRELVSLLARYEQNRKSYPTISDFYPELIRFFNETAVNISQSKADFESRIPKVVSIEPFMNNAQDVDTSTAIVAIRFSDSMMGTGYSFTLGELGKAADPVTGIVGYSDGNRIFRVNVALKPGRDYEMILTGRSFMNTEGYRLKRYIIRFRTKGFSEAM